MIQWTASGSQQSPQQTQGERCQPGSDQSHLAVVKYVWKEQKILLVHIFYERLYTHNVLIASTLTPTWLSPT